MLRYIIRRVGQGALTVLSVLLLLFVLFFLVTTPEDAARLALGEKASPEALEQWKVNHGYDRPYFWNNENPSDTIIFEHFRRMLTFDFGRSDADDAPIAARLRAGAGPSLALSIPLFILGLLLSIAISLFVAFVRETPLDRGVVVVCVLTMSVSTLLYIIGVQFLVGKVLRWFPISGFDPSFDLIARFLAMPIGVGLLDGTGRDVRFYRTVFLEETGRD
jgi:peptide/nickel transport system permease protein